VSLLVDIPANISDSWYSGQVNVCLKESAFQPSSPFRHACELYKILEQANFDKPMLCIYTARTPPYHGWRNPVERAMSLLNLGLQCVDLMRREGSELFERDMVQCGNLKTLRNAGDKREVIY